MGIQTVRLYTNTVSTVPTTFTDITAQFSGLDPNTVADEVKSATITIPNLPSATTVFAWIEALDEAGNSSGVQPVGSATTRERYYVGFGSPSTGIVITARTTSLGSPYALINTVSAPFTSDGGGVQWVTYQLPSQRKLTRYRVLARRDNFGKPSGWKIYGSDDGSTFTLVHYVLLPAGQFIPNYDVPFDLLIP